MKNKIISKINKNIHDYEISDKFFSGIVLKGNEIKSIKDNDVSIDNSYCYFDNKELYVYNMKISCYKKSFKKNFSNNEKRKILLKKSEIKKIKKELINKNLSIIVLSLFLNTKGWAKLEIALAKRLKKYQIKNKIKEKDLIREIKNDFF